MTRTTPVTTAPAREHGLGPAPQALRPTGIEIVGDVPWGTHFCQFYATRDDLADVLVRYFKAGLEAGESCMWVTSPPLDVDDAWAALRRAVPDLEAYRERGQLEIISHRDWYLLGGHFDQDRVLAGWVSRLEDALARGLAGLRLSGNTFWLEKADWRTFAEYEAAVDGVLGRYRMLALCTYSVDRCGASEVADVIRNHEFALIKRDGQWEVFESFERRRMQDALAAERERLAVTLQSIGDAVIATDTEGRITTLNPSAEALTGWLAEQAAGKPIGEVFRLVDERTGAAATDPIDEVLASGAVVGLASDAALVTRDGRRIAVADSAAPIRGRRGETLGVVLVFRDVTAERRAAAALRDSEARARLKLESILCPAGDARELDLAEIIDARALQGLMDELYRLARIPMSLVDLEGKVLVGVGWQEICTRFHRVHPETCRHCIESDTRLALGVPAGEFKLYKCKNNMWDIATPVVVGGHHVGNVFMGQFFFDDECVDRELFREQARRYGFPEHEYLRSLDAVPRLSRATVDVAMAFFLKLAAILSKLSYSNVTLARAIAERDALMTSLRQSKERLEAADRRKDEFLGMLSHELRNPLAPIRSSVFVLEHADSRGEESARARAIIQRQAEHLTRLVEDLLDVTRVARGKIELRRERLDVREVVRRTAEDFRAVLESHDVGFRVELPERPLWADVDPTRLAQVIGNLLQNAAKFTRRGDAVSLSARAVNAAAEIAVRDTGAGIEPALLPEVFQPFVQGQATLARSEGGLGLGLALVKGITELHGGTVRAVSAGKGRGAEFVVTLPLVASPSAREQVTPVARAMRSARVLVVDDNTDAADSLAEMIRLLGHTVEVAYDGPTAIERAGASPPDVVLCDIGLPGMSGYQVAAALRAGRGAGVKLVALTGYAQPEDVARAIAAGFDAHVAKPADPADIARLLAT